jgi:uncharacterized protein YqjF (DUF2071 family)
MIGVRTALRPLEAMVRQPRVLKRKGHRPWPVPDAPWLMAQTWERLLFAHWRVDPDELRRVVHPSLPLDTFDGSAWLGVTPFRVEAFRLHLTPPLPLIHAFPEVNVRTYVTIDGRPGIYFFSLDAASRFAVESARRIYRVPYHHARMRFAPADGEVDFTSERVQRDGPPAELALRYRPAGERFEPVPGTLDHFLTERYCLYTLDERQRVLRGDIHHPPWSVRRAWAEIERNTMARQIGLELDGEPLLHLADRQDVLFWTLRPA